MLYTIERIKIAYAEMAGILAEYKYKAILKLKLLIVKINAHYNLISKLDSETFHGNVSRMECIFSFKLIYFSPYLLYSII